MPPPPQGMYGMLSFGRCSDHTNNTTYSLFKSCFLQKASFQNLWSKDKSNRQTQSRLCTCYLYISWIVPVILTMFLTRLSLFNELVYNKHPKTIWKSWFNNPAFKDQVFFPLNHKSWSTNGITWCSNWLQNNAKQKRMGRKDEVGVQIKLARSWSSLKLVAHIILCYNFSQEVSFKSIDDVYSFQMATPKYINNIFFTQQNIDPHGEQEKSY